MQHINSITNLGNIIDDPPLTQNMNAYLLCACSNSVNRLPVMRFESVLERTKFKTGSTTSFFRKVL